MQWLSKSHSFMSNQQADTWWRISQQHMSEGKHNLPHIRNFLVIFKSCKHREKRRKAKPRNLNPRCSKNRYTGFPFWLVWTIIVPFDIYRKFSKLELPVMPLSHVSWSFSKLHLSPFMLFSVSKNCRTKTEERKE